ncbi:hypothetical protein ATL39_2975 [Sinobaca qinghaiensis]|uniref:Uncharacterized protein n=1 Tax=Sinobaca qinghaiensis TaxID=342944 RepID=A0A419UWP4_9BACL|nr:hypothetical protein [Sinobaca qinghaiensis]RKD69555.1 hypothetical protein ATL39_2975 [Sinobaca qinghaiensis]
MIIQQKELQLMKKIDEYIGYNISSVLFHHSVHVWIFISNENDNGIRLRNLILQLQQRNLISVAMIQESMGHTHYMQLTSTPKLQQLVQEHHPRDIQ